jgi:hypothetical protein
MSRAIVATGSSLHVKTLSFVVEHGPVASSPMLQVLHQRDHQHPDRMRQR